jgi:hypothetical protein
MKEKKKKEEKELRQVYCTCDLPPRALSLPFSLDVGQLAQFIDLLALVKISQYIKTRLSSGSWARGDRLNVFVVWFYFSFFFLLSPSLHSEVLLHQVRADPWENFLILNVSVKWCGKTTTKKKDSLPIPLPLLLEKGVGEEEKWAHILISLILCTFLVFTVIVKVELPQRDKHQKHVFFLIFIEGNFFFM